MQGNTEHSLGIGPPFTALQLTFSIFTLLSPFCVSYLFVTFTLINRNTPTICLIIRKSRITFTANGRNDHVTMFTLYLPLVVFSFSAKLSSFALASKVRIILHYSHPCTNFFKKTSTPISRLLFAVNAILNLSNK